MKKDLFVLAMAIMALCCIAISCKKENPNEPKDNGGKQETNSQFVGVYDLHLVYDSVTDSEGTWFENEFFESKTGKRNPPKDGYLTIAEGKDGKLAVTATIVTDSTSTEKTLFETTATEKDGILILDDCESDYYYDTTEEFINFTFHGFENRLPEIYFKAIYTINLGADYSYLLSFTCKKRG